MDDQNELSRSEVRDIGRAISGDWELPDNLKQSLPARLAAMAEQTKDLRVACRAAEILRKMNADNMTQGSPNQGQEPVLIFMPSNGRESTT